MKLHAFIQLTALIFATWIASGADDNKGGNFDSHDGYFVSNKFEPDAPASFVVIQDQESFDKVFGSAFVMHDKSHRLPKDGFASKIVIAAIKRGNATCEFKVQNVAVKDGTVTVTYNVTSTSHPSATFACPLILSIARGVFHSVEFIEDGKAVGTVQVKSAAGIKP